MYDTTSHDMAASNVLQLYSDIFEEETLPFCFSCQTYGHCTLACPACSKSNQPFCFSTASLPSSLLEPSHLSSSSFKQSPGPQQLQPAAICHEFNQCFCWWPNCQFQHIYNKPDCEGNHDSITTPFSISTPTVLINISNLAAQLKNNPVPQFATDLLHYL